MSGMLTQSSGGATFTQQSHLNKNTVNYIVLLFVVVGITFVQNIPIEIRRWYNSSLGSAVGLGAVVGAYYWFNWTTALLIGLLLVLTINSSILHEGFNPGLDVRLIRNNTKWYIEQVLGENPTIIEDSTVNTRAVQDDNTGMSSGIQSGSNL